MHLWNSSVDLLLVGLYSEFQSVSLTVPVPMPVPCRSVMKFTDINYPLALYENELKRKSDYNYQNIRTLMIVSLRSWMHAWYYVKSDTGKNTNCKYYKYENDIFVNVAFIRPKVINIYEIRYEHILAIFHKYFSISIKLKLYPQSKNTMPTNKEAKSNRQLLMAY